MVFNYAEDQIIKHVLKNTTGMNSLKIFQFISSVILIATGERLDTENVHTGQAHQFHHHKEQTYQESNCVFHLRSTQ
jgi:galactokinase/mevalonate kinase-like predicted kinase